MAGQSKLANRSARRWARPGSASQRRHSPGADSPAVLVELAGEPVVTLDGRLGRVREPGLQAHVEHTEPVVEEGEVEEEALPPREADGRPPLPIGEAKAAGGLDRR